MWVVLRENADKGILPLYSGERPWQAVVDIPEDRSSKADIVLDETHATIPRLTALIVVSDDIVVRQVGVSTQVALVEVPCLISGEVEENVQAINITGAQAYGVTGLCSRIARLQEVIEHLWRTGHFPSLLQAKNEEIKDETIVLEDKGRELRTTNETEHIHVRHILVGQHRIILRSDVIRQDVIENETEVRWEKEEGITEEVTEGEIALDEDVGKDEVDGAGEVRPP